jgi:hypothetical protein
MEQSLQIVLGLASFNMLVLAWLIHKLKQENITNPLNK